MNRWATMLVLLAAILGAVWWVTGGDLDALRGIVRDPVEQRDTITQDSPAGQPQTPRPPAPKAKPPAQPQPEPHPPVTQDPAAPDPAAAADAAAANLPEGPDQAEAAAEAAIKAADDAVAAAENAAQAPLPPVTLPEQPPQTPQGAAPLSTPPAGEALPAAAPAPASDTPPASQADTPAGDSALSVEGFDLKRIKDIIARSGLPEAQQATLRSLAQSAADNPTLRRNVLEQIKVSLP